jgi:hypothetical protein
MSPRRPDLREVLLKDLARVNEALARNGALPDLTVEEAEGMRSVTALRISVEASENRLAAIISASSR